MGYRNITWPPTVMRRVLLLGLAAIDFYPIALIVLVALPLCTTMPARNLRSNADVPTVTEMLVAAGIT